MAVIGNYAPLWDALDYVLHNPEQHDQTVFMVRPTPHTPQRGCVLGWMVLRSGDYHLVEAVATHMCPVQANNGVLVDWEHAGQRLLDVADEHWRELYEWLFADSLDLDTICRNAQLLALRDGAPIPPGLFPAHLEV